MSKAWRWQSRQPIAAWIALCRSPSVIVPGPSSRRQTGGFTPRSVTFRLMMFLLALVFGALVLATIFASCRHRTSAPMPPSAMICAITLPTASGRWPYLCADRQGPSVHGEADGVKDGDGPSSGCLEHRPDVGVEAGGPFRGGANGELAGEGARGEGPL